jgi:hypothetical protein
LAQQAQAGQPAGQMADASKAVVGGGIKVPGWMGKVDAGEAKAGLTVESAKFEREGSGIHVTTGPAIVYWNPANKAMGDYTVKATFTEPKFMNLMEHAHPYGLFIGGNDMGTASQSLLYCMAYGDGRFIVRGFGPTPFQLGGRRGAPAPSVNKAAGKDQPVTQAIEMSVRGDTITCTINGAVVATHSKAEAVGEGKLKSTDGIWGVRFGHNTEAIVSGLGMSK